MGWRVVPGPPWASSSILDQNPPDSQTLRLDEAMDAIGDDDPFTAKLSFEVRCFKSGRCGEAWWRAISTFPRHSGSLSVAVGKRAGQLPAVPGWFRGRFRAAVGRMSLSGMPGVEMW